MEHRVSARNDAIPAQQIQRALLTKSFELHVKRCIDVILSATALAVLSPILLILALAVKLSSRGKILFRQERCGLHGRMFKMIKFRTMLRSEDWPAEWRADEPLIQNGILKKQRHDTRVTPIGRIMRRCSLDELPQLFNVLVGDMSLIGPRPLIPGLIEMYPELNKVRHLVRPGISGLWQIRNRARGTSVLNMVDDDLEYLRRLSLKLDVQILLQTLPLLMGDDNAF